MADDAQPNCSYGQPVAVIYNPVLVQRVALLAAIQSAAPSIAMQVSAASAQDADEIEHVIEAFASTVAE